MTTLNYDSGKRRITAAIRSRPAFSRSNFQGKNAIFALRPRALLAYYNSPLIGSYSRFDAAPFAQMGAKFFKNLSCLLSAETRARVSVCALERESETAGLLV